MAPLPSREVLQSLKRSDLQKLCKDYGVRANLKSEAIIDLLIETQSAPALASRPAARQRSISTRTSSRAGPSRIPSDVTQDIEAKTPQEVAKFVFEGAKPDSPSKPPPRTRKAKELQKHLGVGRPVAAGGTGPRAVTRSTTVSRGKGLRNSQSFKQMEDTIAEEPEGSRNEFEAHPIRTTATDAQQSSSPLTQSHDSPSMEKQNITHSPPPFLPHFEKLLSNAIKPLQEQIQTLQAEVKRMQSLELDLNQLRRQLTHLRTESGRRLSISHPSTPPATTSPNSHIISNDIHAIRTSPPLSSESGPAPLLGKRQRDLSVDKTDKMEQRTRRQRSPDNQSLQSPLRKRPRLINEPSSVKGKEKAPASPMNKDYLRDDNEGVSSNAMARVTSFIVYNDPEDEPLRDSPPALLPDYYTSRTDSLNANSNSPKPVPSTSSANAPENLNPFQFSFGPPTSTPSQSFMPALPYPEPPLSPSPAGSSLVSLNRNTPDRTDIFKPFGLPPPDRGGRLPSGSQPSNTINPAALSQRDPTAKIVPSSNEIGASLGLIPVVTPPLRALSSSGEVPVVKKTMYGTELEGNTRFGDFGVEGVADGFWTGSRL